MNKLSPEKGVIVVLIILICIYFLYTRTGSVESYNNYYDTMNELAALNKIMSLEDEDAKSKIIAYEEPSESTEPNVLAEEELDEPTEDNCIHDSDYASIFKHKILDPYVYTE